MKPMKVAVIGVGIMGSHHARVYRQLPAVDLIGLAEIDPMNAKRAADEFGLSPHDDYRKMLESLRPQIVSVAVPASLHEEIVIASLEAGADVIVEKPIAVTPAEAARMIACAHRLGRQLMVGHIERFNPIIQILKNEVDSQQLGQVYQMVCRRSSPFPERVRDVGVVLDTAVHDLDIISFVSGQAPVSVFAETNHYLRQEHEDTLFGILHYKNTFRGILDINWLSAHKTREIFAYTEDGVLHADIAAQTLALHGKDGRLSMRPVPLQNPLKSELQYFLHSVQKGIPVLEGSTHDAFSALCVAQALLESGRAHQLRQIPVVSEELLI